MNKKTVIILTGIFAGLLVILVFRGKLENTVRRQVFKKLSVEKIKIEMKGESIELRKEDGNWYSGGWTADIEAVNRVLSSIKEINPEEVVSTRKDVYPDYEVTPGSGVTVSVWSFKKKEIRFYVGKRSVEWTKSFLRIEGDPAVYLVGVNKEMFVTDESYWKEKNTAEENKNEIKMEKK